ncbi:TIGR03086 family metal-binding protein [Kibdelosporangium lantanae]
MFEDLRRALAVMDELIAGIRDDQWSAPTPCTEWDVRDLVRHLAAGNRAITAMLRGEPMPGQQPAGDDPRAEFQETTAVLLAVAREPGALDTVAEGPLGKATGAERVQWRLADLVTHTWDLARATGQPLELPDDLVERVLAFAREKLPAQARGGRFGEPLPVSDDASAIDRLVAFSGRPLS